MVEAKKKEAEAEIKKKEAKVELLKEEIGWETFLHNDTNALEVGITVNDDNDKATTTKTIDPGDK